MASRLITINIRKYLATQPVSRRRNKAVRYIRDRIAHYTKTEVGNVKMSQELNQMIFKQHWRKMTPVKVNVSIENGVANASPFQAVKKEEPKAAPQKAVAATPVPAKKADEKKAPAAKAAPKPAAKPNDKK